MSDKQIRLLLLLEFRKHTNANDAAGNICEAIGPSAVSYDSAAVWFRKFRTGTLTSRINPAVWKRVEWMRSPSEAGSWGPPA